MLRFINQYVYLLYSYLSFKVDDDQTSTGALSTGSPTPMPPTGRHGNMMAKMPRAHAGGKLHIQGAVPMEMHHTAHEIEYTINKKVPRKSQTIAKTQSL